MHLSAQALGLVVVAVLGLVALGGFVPAVVLAFRAGVFAFWAAALAVKFLITRPRLGGAAVATGIVGWLVWPYLGGVSDAWLVVVGLAGAAIFVPVMAYAIIGQQRFGADLRASIITDSGNGATQQIPAGHWSEDYR